jgi:ankyrin repeat protein
MAVEDGAPAEVAEMLMKADRESITRKDERGHLPLHVALVYGQTNDMVRTLLKANPAACAVPAERGSFPLHLVLNPHFPVTVVKEILKEHPKAVFEANNEGLTPLHLACTRGSVECVELILKANPAAAAMYARNRGLPLHVAASAGALGRLDPKSASEICQALVHAFPDAATRVDEEGRLPIHLAAESETGKEVIETLYIAFPGGIHHVDAGGRSPADRVPRADKIRLLIEGMDPQDVKREREKREAAARRAKKPMYAAAATGAGAAAKKRKGKGGKDGDDASGKEAAERYLSGADALSLVARVCQGASSDLVSDDLASLKRSLLRYADVVDDELRRVLLTPVPVRPRRRGERRSLRRTFPGASLRPGSLAHDPDTPRRLSTPPLTPFNSTLTSLRMDPRPSGVGRSRRRSSRVDRSGCARSGTRSCATPSSRRTGITTRGRRSRRGCGGRGGRRSARTIPTLRGRTRTTTTSRPTTLIPTPQTLRPTPTTRSGAFYTLVPIRPRRRGERRSLRTFAVVSLPPSLAFNPRPRRLSTPTDAFELHPDVRSYGTTLRNPYVNRRGRGGGGGGNRGRGGGGGNGGGKKKAASRARWKSPMTNVDVKSFEIFPAEAMRAEIERAVAAEMVKGEGEGEGEGEGVDVEASRAALRGKAVADTNKNKKRRTK